MISLAINVLLLFQSQNQSQDNTTTFTKQEQKYPLLSKRILNDFPNDLLINFSPLRSDLKTKVADYGQDFGFYFEYLPTGTSIGVNSTQEFAALSLLKVPIVMAYFHQKEVLNKGNEVITVTQDELDKAFGSLWEKGAGYRISLDQTAKLAITDSDNTALRVLTDHIQKKYFDDVYSGLDINLQTGDNGVILTARSYSSILKALYFSSLLKKDNSQLVLNYMTQTKFSDKLPAGIPGNIQVAHKVGIYQNQLFTDCGIVYIPRRPYLLCMVSNSDDVTARERMITVSKTVYDYVANADK